MPPAVNPSTGGTIERGTGLEIGPLEGEMPAWANPVTGEPIPAKPAGASGLESTSMERVTGNNVYKHQFKYADRVRMRGVQDPVSHNFPYSFDDAILSTTAIEKSGGYKIFQLQGAMNGKPGVYEIGLQPSGIIDHRFFRPFK